LFGDSGFERIDLCGICASKAKNRDAETWAKIRDVLRIR